jgi:hypothetical protein
VGKRLAGAGASGLGPRELAAGAGAGRAAGGAGAARAQQARRAQGRRCARAGAERAAQTRTARGTGARAATAHRRCWRRVQAQVWAGAGAAQEQALEQARRKSGHWSGAILAAQERLAGGAGAGRQRGSCGVQAGRARGAMSAVCRARGQRRPGPPFPELVAVMQSSAQVWRGKAGANAGPAAGGAVQGNDVQSDDVQGDNVQGNGVQRIAVSPLDALRPRPGRCAGKSRAVREELQRGGCKRIRMGVAGPCVEDVGGC